MGDEVGPKKRADRQKRSQHGGGLPTGVFNERRQRRDHGEEDQTDCADGRDQDERRIAHRGDQLVFDDAAGGENLACALQAEREIAARLPRRQERGNDRVMRAEQARESLVAAFSPADGDGKDIAGFSEAGARAPPAEDRQRRADVGAGTK